LNIDGLPAVEPGASLFILEPVHHPGHILEINRLPVVQAHHQAVNLIRRPELARYAQLEATVTHLNGATGYVLVLLGDHILQHQDGKPEIGQLVRIRFDAHLPFQPTGHIHFQHPGDGFKILLQILADLFQPFQAGCPGQGKNHDGHLGNVDLAHIRIILKVPRQVLLGHVNLILGLVQNIVDVGSGHKFDNDGAHALGA